MDITTIEFLLGLLIILTIISAIVTVIKKILR